MRDLWKAVTLLVLDEPLRTAVIAAAKFTQRPDLPKGCSPPLPNFADQPDVNALRQIDTLFRAKGLYLGAYALSEINRWMVDGGAPFLQALKDLREELHSIPAGSQPSPAMAEAAGVLVADPKLRFLFQTAATNLRGNGFQVSAAEEAALRTDFASGTQADFLAKKIFDLGWTTGSCEGRFLPYDGMFHFNL